MTTKTPKTTTPAVRGAQLYNKILELRRRRDEKIANAPSSFTDWCDGEEKKAMARYSEEERAYAEKLLGE